MSIHTFIFLGGGAGDANSWLQQLGFDDEYLMTERSLGLAQHGTSSAADNPAHMDERWLDNLLPEGGLLVCWLILIACLIVAS